MTIRPKVHELTLELQAGWYVLRVHPSGAHDFFGWCYFPERFEEMHEELLEVGDG